MKSKLIKQLLIPRILTFSKERVGDKSTGGFVLLQHNLNTIDAVYSFGVGRNVSFELDMANHYYCLVYQYDANVSAMPYYHPNFIFRKIPPTKDTLPKMLAQNGHGHSNHLILKIDVEGAEWAILHECPVQVLLKFEQIIVQYHGLCEPDEQMIEVLYRMNQLFYISHIHADNQGRVSGHNVPDILDISYIRKDLVVNEPPLETEKYPVSGIDFPSQPCLPDIELDWWTSAPKDGYKNNTNVIVV